MRALRVFPRKILRFRAKEKETLPQRGSDENPIPLLSLRQISAEGRMAVGEEEGRKAGIERSRDTLRTGWYHPRRFPFAPSEEPSGLHVDESPGTFTCRGAL